MKGQITAEYLLLSLIGLVLISFSIITLAQIRESGIDSYELILLKESASGLANTVDTVCTLGNYNSRAIYLKSEVDISGGETNGKQYIIVASRKSGDEIALEVICPVNGRGDVYGKTKVVNKNGEIYIEN